MIFEVFDLADRRPTDLKQMLKRKQTLCLLYELIAVFDICVILAKYRTRLSRYSGESTAISQNQGEHGDLSKYETKVSNYNTLLSNKSN